MKKILSIIGIGLIAYFVLLNVGNNDTGSDEEQYEYIIEENNEYLEGSGTSSDPYLIYDAEDFYHMRDTPSAHYELQNDINFSDQVVDLGNGLVTTTIVRLDVPFSGVFDGQGYRLTYQSSEPIFPELRGAKIQNLQIENDFEVEEAIVEYEYQDYTRKCVYAPSGSSIEEGDILAGKNLHTKNYGLIASTADEESIVNNIYVELLATMYFSNSGPRDVDIFHNGIIIGENHGTISNVYIVANINAKEKDQAFQSSIDFTFGGITGYNTGSIEYVQIYGVIDITNKADASVYLGGIAGMNEGNINHVFVKQTLINSNSDNRAFTGGVVGYNERFGEILESVVDAYLEAKGSGVNLVGGIAGFNRSIIKHSISNVDINIKFGLNFESVNYVSGEIIAGGYVDLIENTYFVGNEEDTKIYGRSYPNNLDYIVSVDELDAFVDDEYIIIAGFNINEEQEIVLSFDSDYWTNNRLIISMDSENGGE